MTTSVGLRSLAVSLPETVRSNDYFRDKCPELVAEHEQRTLARLFATSQQAAASAAPVDEEMNAYLRDPFRGTVERRVVAPGETALSLEVRAARGALSAARMAPRDVEMMIVTSFLPDTPGVGHAAPLARELGLRAPAFNVESTCSSALVSLEAACALVRTGQYKNVLVVVSCTYSRVADERDTLSWFLGDGAGAFVVSAVERDSGVLACKTVGTAETCDTFYFELGDAGDAAGVRPIIRCTPQTQRILRETAAGYVRECCGQAARAAGMRLTDVDVFVFNTPTAWFAAACARALGIEFRRTVNTYPMYANVGPALMPINLHHAVRSGRLHRGDLVMVFTIGSVGTAAAALMRWGDVGVAG